MHLYLIRHGESQVNVPVADGRSFDDLDLGLTDEGQKQAQAVVGHGGTVNAVSDTIFNIGSYRQCDIRGNYTGVTLFQYMGKPNWETWRLHYLSRVDHLVNS